jgi:ABC-type branched-subunit amino acid transport system ATPase component
LRHGLTRPEADADDTPRDAMRIAIAPYGAEAGLTILLVEQDVHRTLALSHHAYVVAKGRIFRDLDCWELVELAVVAT